MIQHACAQGVTGKIDGAVTFDPGTDYIEVRTMTLSQATVKPSLSASGLGWRI